MGAKSSNNPISSRGASRFPAPAAAVILLSLCVKLSLLRWNAGEYTDGIIQLRLWTSPIAFFPPGYSALVWLMDWLIHDLVVSGRMVSILASTITLALVHRIALGVFEKERPAFWAVLFLALSPIFNRWSIRVMTDSLFCLMFAVCVYVLFEILNRRRFSVWALVFATGLAVLVRYQGLFFVPFIAWILLKEAKAKTLRFDGAAILKMIGASLPWAVMAAWVAMRGFGHHQQFAERAALGFWTTLIAYWQMFETYIIYFPWAAGHCLFALGVAGCVLCWSGNCAQRRFMQFSIIAALAFLTAQSCFLSFQYRYLLPLIPLWCVAAAKGLDWIIEKSASAKLAAFAKTATCLNLALMSLAVIHCQQATFGDVKETAVYLRDVWKDARVFSDETYGAHADNVKMEFWSGREIAPIGSSEFQAGDLVAIHNVYTPNHDELMKHLNDHFDVAILFRSSMAGSFITWPLLPDIMVNPKIPLTSNPECMAFRFAPQPYFSIVVRLDKKS